MIFQWDKFGRVLFSFEMNQNSASKSTNKAIDVIANYIFIQGNATQLHYMTIQCMHCMMNKFVIFAPHYGKHITYN